MRVPVRNWAFVGDEEKRVGFAGWIDSQRVTLHSIHIQDQH